MGKSNSPFRISNIVLIFAIIQFSSCNLFDTIEQVGNAKLLWRTTLPIGYSIGNIGNVQYNNGVLLNRLENDAGIVYFIDGATGAIRWKWNDALQDDRLYFSQVYQNGKCMVAATGTGLYGIDLETGRTLWKKQLSQYGNTITGLGDSFYLLTSAYSAVDDTYIMNVARGNLQDGTFADVITQKNNWPKSYSAEPVTIGADEGLLIIQQKKISAGKYQTSFSLYNQTKFNWEYQERLVDTKKYNSKRAIFNVNKSSVLFGSDSTIYAITTTTASVEWARKQSTDIELVKCLANGNLIAIAPDDTMYALNPITGNQLWQQKTYSPSELIELNNGIYLFEFKKGLLLSSTNYFSAIDANNGRVMWRFEDENRYDRKINVLESANGGNGSVVLCNSTTVFCYEAIN